MVKRLDEAFGRLMDTLRSLDMTDNTIVLFTTDHGCHFKTRNDEYKRSCHEASIRIPAMLHGPGFNAGGQIRELVSLIDLPPTLLDAAGIPVPERMQGRSLMPLIRGEDRSWPDDVFVQISESQIGRAIRTRKWKYSVSAPNSSRTDAPGSDRYVEEFLYDLETDPYELTNLIGLESHRAVADRPEAAPDRPDGAGRRAGSGHRKRAAQTVRATVRHGRGSGTVRDWELNINKPQALQQ